MITDIDDYTIKDIVIIKIKISDMDKIKSIIKGDDYNYSISNHYFFIIRNIKNEDKENKLLYLFNTRRIVHPTLKVLIKLNIKTIKFISNPNKSKILAHINSAIIQNIDELAESYFE